MMKFVKANLNDEHHKKMYASFCKKNNLNIFDLFDELEESNYQENLYFFIEKQKEILESCKTILEKDLKKATIQILIDEQKKKESFLKLILSTIHYLFETEQMESIYLEVKDNTLEEYLKEQGYDTLSFGENLEGKTCYSIEKN